MGRGWKKWNEQKLNGATRRGARTSAGSTAAGNAAPAKPSAPVETQRGLRRHALLPADVRRKLPPPYSQEGLGLGAKPHLKLFSTTTRFTAYITEWGGKDLLYGYIVSPHGSAEDDWGYLSFAELETMVDRRFGVGIPAIERDCYWSADTVREALQRDGVALPAERVSSASLADEPTPSDLRELEDLRVLATDMRSDG